MTLGEAAIIFLTGVLFGFLVTSCLRDGEDKRKQEHTKTTVQTIPPPIQSRAARPKDVGIVGRQRGASVDARLMEKHIPKSEPSELWFFPDENMPCISMTGLKRWRCNNQRCNYLHVRDDNNSLLKIIDTLRDASQIELCMYRFTLRQISDLFLAKHKEQKTKIRIISDNALDTVENNQIPRLKNAGIEVRERDAAAGDKVRPLMHNKFVIVDNTCCLIGSFNWTHAAATRNQEAVLKSYEPHIVKELKRKFEQMWNELDKVKPTESIGGLTHIV